MITFRNAVILTIAVLTSCTGRQTVMPSASFHGNPQHTGFFTASGPERLHGMKWKFETRGRVFSSPVIWKDNLYIGSDDSTFYALDAQKGTLLWKYKTGGRVSSSAAVFDDKVYFVSFDGYAYCLSANTGTEIWKFRTAGEKVFSAPGIHGVPEKDRPLDDPWEMFLSSPVVAEGKVYFGSGSGMFYALDCNTGALQWEYKTGDVIHASPAYADSTVYVGSWDSYLYALQASTGDLRWKFKTGIDTVIYNQVGFQSSPAIAGGTVYTGCRDAHVYAIDAQTGQMKWKYYNNGSWVISTPAVHSDTLYFTTSDTHKLIALKASNGKEIYTGNCKTYAFSSPALATGMVYVGNFGGSLMAFAAKSGLPVWEFRTPAAAANTDSILNATGEFNFLKIFRENTYKGMQDAVNTIYSLGSVVSSPAVFNGTVYFGSTDGYVYALH